MTTVRITVDWLDRTYHGEEWPPSPWRMFGAMRAGSARHYPDNPALDAAMRHLETLDPPVITAPRAEVRAPVTAAVPNNDADRELALYARGEPAHAREQHRRSVSLRTRRPRVVDGELAYDWPATPGTAGHAGAIATIARCISALGLGVDLAVVRAELVERPAPLAGVRYTPSAAGRRILDVPYPGAFEALEERYRQLRRRIDAGVVSPVCEPERRPGALSLRARPAARAHPRLRPAWGRREAARRGGDARDGRRGDGPPRDWARRPARRRRAGRRLGADGSRRGRANCDPSAAQRRTPVCGRADSAGGADRTGVRRRGGVGRRGDAARGRDTVPGAAGRTGRGCWRRWPVRTRFSGGCSASRGCGRRRHLWCCRATTTGGAGRGRSARCGGCCATQGSARRWSNRWCWSPGRGLPGARIRRATAARATSSATPARISRCGGRHR